MTNYWTGKHLSKKHRKKISDSNINKKFSDIHIKKLSIARRKRVGSKHPRWKGGRTISNFGYVVVWTPKGMKREHRMVMEKHLERKLKSNELVHHINGIKTDNRLKNLKLMSSRKHMQLHANPKLFFKKGHKIGLKTRFKKGHIPWSQGKKIKK